MRSPSQDSGRRHSVSSEDEFVRPHRGRLDDKTQGPRRIRLPRSKSASDMLDVYNNTDPATREEDLRNIVREQVDREAVRELAEFLRTTGPRIHPGYRDDECFRVPTHGTGSGRWSLQQLKTKRVRFDRSSLQQLPESARPGTTTQGNHYIAISVPNPDSLGGPWSRSQYPVYAATPASPTNADSTHWPPRGSSRGILGPTREEFPSVAVSPKGPMTRKTLYIHEADSNSLAELNKSLAEHLSSVTDHGNQVQEVDRTPQPDSDDETAIISIRRRGSTAPMFLRERSGTASTCRTSRLRVNMDEPPTVQVESADPTDALQDGNDPDLVHFRVRSAATPPCVAQPEEPKFPEVRVEGVEAPSMLSLRVHKRGLSTFPSTSSTGSSPTSPRRSRPANITVGSTLMVPKESPLPDSPGFPTMLAAMTFPSPPKSSPSHSPSASITSFGSRPNSVQGNVSSSTKPRHNNDQARSLNEVVMQSTQPVPPLEESEDGLDTPRNLPRPLTLPDYSISHQSGSPRGELDEHNGRPQSSGSCATTKPDRCESSGSFYTADESYRFSTSTAAFELDGEDYDPYDLSEMSTVSKRQSRMTNDSYRQSGVTDESYRQSTRSDSTVATDFSMDDSFGKSLRLSRVVLRSSVSNVPDGRKGSLADSVNSADDECSFHSSERSDTPSSLRSTLTDEDDQPRSILERRMARRAKVREYKQKDLATVRTAPMNALGVDSVDSPVLGWFTQPSSKPKRISVLSPLSRSAQRSVSSTATTPTTPIQRVMSIMPDTPVSQESFVKIHKRRANMDISNSPRNSIAESKASRDWSISPVMVLESTPTHPVEHASSPTRLAFEERKDLTLSPMILVAESVGHTGPKPTSLRPLSLLTETAPVLPPRSALRLKIRPQRPLPIKIAGVVTTTIPEAPRESKSRHSISTMPTPPMSPEMRISNRMSFPVLAAEPRSADGPSDRVSLQRRREKHIIQQNEKKENEWLQAHQKEREQEWRIAAIKERLRREKMEKDKETADLAAASSEPQLSPIVASPAITESERAHSGNKRFSVDIEQRLDRLEKSGDAYLRIMVPLLENMNRTLAEMRKDGVGAGTTTMGLRMSDFVFDMKNESNNRMSIADTMSGPSSAKASTPTFHSEAHNRHRSSSKSSMGSQKMAARVEMNMSRPRSRRNTQTSSRGENTMAASKKSDEIIRRSNDTQVSGRMSPEKKPLPSVPQSSLEDVAETPLPALPPKDDEVPRTPKEHQMEAQQAIQRRMEKQEAIFDQLMSGWGMEKKKSRPRSSTLPSRPARSSEEPECP